MSSALGPAVPGLGLDRWRLLGGLIGVVAWLLFIVAIAMAPIASPSSFGGAVGGTIGLFLGTVIRNKEADLRRGVAKALLVAGRFVVAWVSAAVIGAMLRPDPPADGGAWAGWGLLALVLVFAASFLWDVPGRKRAPVRLALCSLVTMLLAVACLLATEPMLVLMTSALVATATLAAIAWALRTAFVRPAG